MTIALFACATGAPVDSAVSLRLTLPGASTPVSRSAGAWAALVAAVPPTVTAAQLAGASPQGYRLPALADWQAIGFEALSAHRIAAEQAGILVTLDLADGAGLQTRQYAGRPPETLPRITEALSASRRALAGGAADSFDFACRLVGDVPANKPAINYPHTVNDLEALETAWVARVADISGVVGSGRTAIEAAQSQAQVDTAVEVARAELQALAATVVEP